VPVFRGSHQALMTGLLSVLLASIIAIAAAPSQARPLQEPFRTSYQPATPTIAGDQPPYTTNVARSGFDHVATAEEKYLASFGTPKPAAAAVHSTPSSDGTPWLVIALVSGGTLLLVGVAGTGLGKRHARRVEIPA
jgi:hypothetical protein